MKAGLPISLLLHGSVFFGFALLGGSAKPLAEGRVIPIDIVTLAPETNIRASIKSPKPKTDTIMELTTPMKRADEVDDVIKDTSDESAPSETIAEAVIPDRETLETTDKTKTETDRAPSFDLDKLSALVDKSKSTAPEANRQTALQGEADTYAFADVSMSGTGEGTDMTLSELDALQSAMYKCWRMPADAKDPEKLIVRLQVKMLQGGFVEDVKVIDRAASRRNAPGNAFWDIAEQRAVRAVSQCAPYDFLPSEKYAQWKTLNLNFRPQI